MNTVDIASAEASYFFNMASLFNAARRNGVSVLEYVDEIEGIALNTESTLLRARAHALLATALRDVTARAGGRFSVSETGVPIVEFIDDNL